MPAPTSRTVAIVAVAAVGFAGCSGVGESDPGPITRPGDGDVVLEVSGAGEGPTHTLHGVPQGWSRRADGARAAAVSAVGLTGEVARSGFITRGDMIDALASRRFAPELAVTTEQQLADLADALGAVELLPPEITWTEVPLTARVVDATDEEARVEVWSVLVIASPEVAVPRQAWRTVTIDLAWEGGDWKVDGWSNTAGPTPALAAAAAISRVEDVMDAAGWPAAATGADPGSDAGAG